MQGGCARRLEVAEQRAVLPRNNLYQIDAASRHRNVRIPLPPARVWHACASLCAPLLIVAKSLQVVHELQARVRHAQLPYAFHLPGPLQMPSACARRRAAGQNGVRKKAKPQGRGGGTNLQEMSSIHRRSNDTSS